MRPTCSRASTGWARAWADPLVEILDARLNFQGMFDEINKTRKRTEQDKKKLRKWAVYAATGGVRDIHNPHPTFPLNWERKHFITGVLKDKKVGFLGRKDNLNL